MKGRIQTWLSYLVILVPVGYGFYNYQNLPAKMATHFNNVNQPDGYLSKPLMVFGLPVLMLLLQWISLSVTRLNASHKGLAPRFERVMTWIIPVVAVITYVTTIGYNLGHQLDIWRIAVSMVAMIFIAVGNYLPTVSPEQYHRMHRGFQPRPMVWRRLRYWYGYTLVGSGILLLLSILMWPGVSIGVLGLMLLTLLATSVYGLFQRA